MLKMLADVGTAQEKAPEPKGPIVVHCSAGVGRTGTFIAIDIAQRELARSGKISVLKMVRQLRECRVAMVQTPPQYKFVHSAVQRFAEMNGRTVEVRRPEDDLDEAMFSPTVLACPPSEIKVPMKQTKHRYLHI